MGSLWVYQTPLRWFSPQDGQLTLRLASACALHIIWVTLVPHLLWQPIKPVLVLGCLSSQGPLGLVLGFYRARVWLFPSPQQYGQATSGVCAMRHRVAQAPFLHWA
jgi:hypothetical protein